MNLYSHDMFNKQKAKNYSIKYLQDLEYPSFSQFTGLIFRLFLKKQNKTKLPYSYFPKEASLLQELEEGALRTNQTPLCSVLIHVLYDFTSPFLNVMSTLDCNLLEGRGCAFPLLSTSSLNKPAVLWALNRILLMIVMFLNMSKKKADNSGLLRPSHA